MKIEYDEQSKIIRVGKAEIDGYRHYKSARSWAMEMLRKNDIYIMRQEENENFQQHNKRLGDKFGCSISVLFKQFNKLQKKAFIVPVYHLYKHVNEYNPFKKSANQFILKQLNDNKEILEEVYKDGLYNLLPVVNALGKSPQELKWVYGKKAWRNVANSSNNKNKLLVKYYRHGKDEKRKQLFEADIPSTLLKYANEFSIPSLVYLKDNFKGKWKNYEEMKQWANTFADTYRLAEKLEEKVNPSWSPRRLKEEHVRMSKELNARRYSPVPFEWTKDLPKVVEHEGYVATLLDSRLLIAEEGTHMGHCVAGYADYSAAGDYLVYSVTKDGERSSTIGIQKGKISYYDTDKDKYDWTLQQHYGRFNASLKNEAEKEIGNLVVKTLNEHMKETQQ